MALLENSNYVDGIRMVIGPSKRVYGKCTIEINILLFIYFIMQRKIDFVTM